MPDICSLKLRPLGLYLLELGCRLIPLDLLDSDARKFFGKMYVKLIMGLKRDNPVSRYCDVSNC